MLPLRRHGGIHPGCSLLTLIMIVHSTAKAFCYAMVQNHTPSRAHSFWQHCEEQSNAIRCFFFLSSKKCLLEQFNCFGNSRASPWMLCIPLLHNTTHSWGIKVISIRIGSSAYKVWGIPSSRRTTCSTLWLIVYQLESIYCRPPNRLVLLKWVSLL